MTAFWDCPPFERHIDEDFQSFQLLKKSWIMGYIQSIHYT